MATSNALAAFRESFFNASPLDFTDDSSWADFDARRLRYDVLWAYFQGNAYRTIHTWAQKHKADYGLYKYVRDIYNPAYELATFYETYVWGGRLDDLAGDGRAVPSALPILTQNATLPPAIAQIWQWSNWKTKRHLVPLYGASMGDAFIQVVDDTERGKVYLKNIHPGIVKDKILDPFGNVKAYTLEYLRTDVDGKEYTYTEIARRGEGEEVIWAQYRNGLPYDWDGQGQPERVVPYGFVPLVAISHKDIGLEWGMSEAFPKLALFREVDDQVSKLNDQVRKTVDSPWLFSGVTPPKSTPAVTGASPTASTRPEPGKDEVPIFYGPADARAQALVADLPIAAVSEHILQMLTRLERIYPELGLYKAREGGSGVSGESIRRMQAEAGAKMERYRDAYDGGLIRAQQMAVAIGGYRGYFKGFGLESFKAGALDHQIGTREVFPSDPVEELNVEKKELENIQTAVNAGIPLDVYLQSRKYDPAFIAAVTGSAEFQARRDALALVSGGGQGSALHL